MLVMEPPSRVILWAAPRCLSSAFERSVRELKGVKVVYEPHRETFYHGPERRYPKLYSLKYASNTYDSADERLTATMMAAVQCLLKMWLITFQRNVFPST